MLDALEIAKPCDARWEDMRGDDRVRRCDLCQLNVYNLSAFHRVEALELLERTEGRVCLRLYQRADGTVITADCTSRLVDAKRAGTSAFAVALALTGVLWAAACGVGAGQEVEVDEPSASPAIEQPLTGEPAPTSPPEPRPLMGAPRPNPEPPHPPKMGKVKAPEPAPPQMGTVEVSPSR
jgi:hypothetical protein